MLVSFENDSVTSKIGSDSAKIDFLQAFPRAMTFQGKVTTFHNSGIFQLKDGPPVLVLPWFFKDSRGIPIIPKEFDLLFDEISRIRAILESKVDLEAGDRPFAALDILSFSFLTNLKHLLLKLCSANYHEEVTDQTRVIKGRWNLSKDIAKGLRPTMFTCTYGSLEIDTPFFRFIKAACRQLDLLLRTKRNLTLLKEVLALLTDVTVVPLSSSLAREAHIWLRAHKLKGELAGTVTFIENLFFGAGTYSERAGVCFRFEMDKFFEELVEKLFSLAGSLEVTRQTREEILGGAVWRVNASQKRPEESRFAIQVAIPDIVVFDTSNYYVVVCKYKPLRIPFINDTDPNQSLSAFGRGDRNQILSFVASLRPTPEVARRTPSFSIFFPCSTVTSHSISELCFESAQVALEPHKKTLTQVDTKIPEGHALRINFVGINILHALQSLVRRDASTITAIINSLNGQTAVSQENLQIGAATGLV